MTQFVAGIPNAWDKATSRITGEQVRSARRQKKRKRGRQSTFSKKTRNWDWVHRQRSFSRV